MSNLTQTAIVSRKATLFFLVTLTISVGALLIWKAAAAVLAPYLPSDKVPASVAFGMLPSLNLSGGFTPPKSLEYSLETVTGKLPSLPGNAKVFSISNKPELLGDLERIKTQVRSAGFVFTGEDIRDGIAKFVDGNDQTRKLTVEIVSGNFVLRSNYIDDPAIISSSIRNEEAAVNLALGYFRDLGLDTGGFPVDKIRTRKLKIDAGQLVESLTLQAANLIEVNLTRAALGGLEVVPVNEETAQVRALVSNSKVVAASNDALPIEKFKFATYPLKGSKLAYEELKAGRGVFNREVSTPSVVISDVSLGYVENKNIKEWLQPVYLFKGTNGLIAFVSAVDDLWIREKATGGF